MLWAACSYRESTGINHSVAITARRSQYRRISIFHFHELHVSADVHYHRNTQLSIHKWLSKRIWQLCLTTAEYAAVVRDHVAVLRGVKIREMDSSGACATQMAGVRSRPIVLKYST